MADMKPKTNKKDTESDVCFTPPYAVKPLVDLVNLCDYSVWEPASGAGDLVDELNFQGVSVFGTTIETGDDFFDDELSEFHMNIYDAIVTNPPYSIKARWIERCYELTDNWALLLPIEVLGGAQYQRLFEDNGGVSILTFDSRVDFKMPTPGKDCIGDKWGRSSAQFPTAWFIHGFGLKPDKIYRRTIKEEKSVFKKLHRMLDT